MSRRRKVLLALVVAVAVGVSAFVVALPEIVRGLAGKAPKRVIVVPNRIVNVVA